MDFVRNAEILPFFLLFLSPAADSTVFPALSAVRIVQQQGGLYCQARFSAFPSLRQHGHRRIVSTRYKVSLRFCRGGVQYGRYLPENLRFRCKPAPSPGGVIWRPVLRGSMADLR